MPSDSQIDDAILAATDPLWTKVAMVIARTAKCFPTGLPEGDAGYQMIADRIGALVREGRLDAKGEITQWRRSEVRRAASNPKTGSSKSGWDSELESPGVL